MKGASGDPDLSGGALPRRLGRGVYILPSLFTVGNILCGYYSILSSMNQNYDRAAWAIGIAILLDFLDGWIARMTKATSGFGLQLDSLADVISFGIAPSILALVWGLSNLNYRFAWMAAFTFAICGAMRLARFNAQAGHFKHFVGLPIPAGGGTIAAIVHFFEEPVRTQMGAGIMVAVVFFLAILMISTIRYNSLKYLTLGKKSHLTILAVALLIYLILFFSRPTLLAIAICYCMSGLSLRTYSYLRRRRAPENLPVPNLLEHH